MKLEQELEVELWDRKKRKAVLTKAGLLFYQDARILIKHYTDAKNKLNRYRSQAQYTLSIGTLPILSQYQLTPVDVYKRQTVNIRSSSHPESASVPIIAMTANSFKEDSDAAAKAGMTGFVSKPVDMDYLLKVLGENIRNA